MPKLDYLLSDLQYENSPSYVRSGDKIDASTAHMFRQVFAAEIDGGQIEGAYVFQLDSTSKVLSSRPAVYIAEAQDVQSARRIHRSLWNSGYAPFVVIGLPHQVRIYTGFDYSEAITDSKEKGLLAEWNDSVDSLAQLKDLLAELSANAVDSGRIWHSKFANSLDPKNRVDVRLLKNLKGLGEALQKTGSLSPEVAHALIGKYVYISYLRDRKILTPQWLSDQSIDENEVLGRNATVHGLMKLVEALENRFNGKIFPLDFYPTDEHVALTASVFMGDEIKSSNAAVRQLHFDFQAYDFQYIPVETLSSIYEQFIDGGKAKGVIYTPEVLADYLLAEVESAKPLKKGTKILDPACGSGVFLVLAYRRLIETEIAKRQGQRLSPRELKALLSNIYGVERELDACRVAEFSLILTLLHYIKPRELDKNPDFQFPSLHDTQIFQADFFDDQSKFWTNDLKFDWIVGNPPWVELKPHSKEDAFARIWMLNNRTAHPVAGMRVAEAFSWRVIDKLKPDGLVGLVMPATSLFNLESKEYRQSFFHANEVVRVTNFANLREVLFGKRGAFPAATTIYRLPTIGQEKPLITHYGPFSVNQISGVNSRPWVITINESEIKTISPQEAASGETSVWKFALWGTYRDKRAIERIRRLFPYTLEQCCEQRAWGRKFPQQGAELRDNLSAVEDLIPRPDLRGKKRLNTDSMNALGYRFSVPALALDDISDEMCFVRRRGGVAGLEIITAPHIVISKAWKNFIAYSDVDFVIPPQQMGISAPKKDAGYLRALSVYLNSSLVDYYLFFQVPEWGTFRQRRSVVVTEVRKIPTPDFTQRQQSRLADLHKELVQEEKRSSAFMASTEISVEQLQDNLDREVFSILDVPEDIAVLAKEFVKYRLPLDGTQKSVNRVTRLPQKKDLTAYGQQLRSELDDFTMGTVRHKVVLKSSKELVECTIEITKHKSSIPVEVVSGEAIPSTEMLLAEIREELGVQFSQWVYVQRGLRIFDGPRIRIYKLPRLIDWTRTQAMNDAGDIIGEAISAGTAQA